MLALMTTLVVMTIFPQFKRTYMNAFKSDPMAYESRGFFKQRGAVMLLPKPSSLELYPDTVIKHVVWIKTGCCMAVGTFDIRTVTRR
jgi:hypothetical protein